MAIITNKHGTFAVSDELANGIAAYYERVKALGGFGVPCRAPCGNSGPVREGTLEEAASCQPVLCTADGKRYAITRGLESVEVI